MNLRDFVTPYIIGVVEGFWPELPAGVPRNCPSVAGAEIYRNVVNFTWQKSRVLRTSFLICQCVRFSLPITAENLKHRATGHRLFHTRFWRHRPFKCIIPVYKKKHHGRSWMKKKGECLLWMPNYSTRIDGWREAYSGMYRTVGQSISFLSTYYFLTRDDIHIPLWDVPSLSLTNSLQHLCFCMDGGSRTFDSNLGRSLLGIIYTICRQCYTYTSNVEFFSLWVCHWCFQNYH